MGWENTALWSYSRIFEDCELIILFYSLLVEGCRIIFRWIIFSGNFIPAFFLTVFSNCLFIYPKY